MTQRAHARTVLLNRLIAVPSAAVVLVYLATKRDYWGVAFMTLAFLWLGLNAPSEDLAWPKTARRVVVAMLALLGVVATWLTLRA
jgi:hypothetical protein